MIGNMEELLNFALEGLASRKTTDNDAQVVSLSIRAATML